MKRDIQLRYCYCRWLHVKQRKTFDNPLFGERRFTKSRQRSASDLHWEYYVTDCEYVWCVSVNYTFTADSCTLLAYWISWELHNVLPFVQWHGKSFRRFKWHIVSITFLCLQYGHTRLRFKVLNKHRPYKEDAFFVSHRHHIPNTGRLKFIDILGQLLRLDWK